jgi:DNA polymerase I-like protein with 3'-5' exonuclease and polymerase domains
MKIQTQDVSTSELTQKSTKKPKKVKEPKDIRYVFRKMLKGIDLPSLKQPWMIQKAFRLINTPEDLQAWVDTVLNDTSRHVELNGVLTPVVALDTENTGLDTRILVDRVLRDDGSWELTYEVKVEIAGICLSSDGMDGIYIPLTHEKEDQDLLIPAINLDRAKCAEIIQYLFDRCHLVFYNAKYDREVMRLTMGINFRPYPHFEDVQVLAYINDPKADLGDKGKYTGSSGGLKALSKNVLGLSQIELDQIAKVKCEYCPVTESPFCHCTPEEKKVLSAAGKKHSLKNQYVPFPWIPTDIALWYAAGDAICTWLLWKKMYELARSRKTSHTIDHELVESITWTERQRWFVDTDRHARTVRGHSKKIGEMRQQLRKMALEMGYEETKQADGSVMEDEQFNPGSSPQLQTLFFKIKGYSVTKFTDAGNPSCDAEVLEDLFKEHPDDDFLKLLMQYRDYMALHPGNLRYDPNDHTARIYLKQNVVAGGRLAAAGGDFEVDGGFGLNPQGIKKVESYLMWKVNGNVLDPDPEEINDEDIIAYEESDLHKSCFNKDNKKAPGIIKNHIGKYMGYAICLVPSCTTCADKYGILIPDTKMDANEVINLRVLFHAPKGWTMFSVDYSNIEMRCAANVSGEPEFINEFLIGKGDFHSLTASKVFPEFTDPSTSKAVRKSLRDLAKIINFALLYGGTEFTIFENMKKKKPDITWEEAKDMVSKYWAGVPVFWEFCQRKQSIAKNEMLCKTATGRIINFSSAMETQHIRVPTDDEMSNYWKYRELMKKSEAAKKEGDGDKSGTYRAMADRLWKDPDSGVRNAMDYNKFMGKIQRVSVNVPLQGLAGDFMRMALNRIRKWVESDPLVQSVFHLHCSVHDEIDFIVKNEYAPFVLPRITRLMKLRALHEKMGWKVPIEADAEYGRSWDVEHHLTGDEDHKAAAWTEIKGMSTYIPDNWDIDTLKNLIRAVGTGEEARIERAKTFLKENLHPRAFNAAGTFFEAKDDRSRKKALITALQLDEFWRIDSIPDNENDKLETLAQFEGRNGLGPDNRDPMTPEFGYLGAIPLTAKVKRPTIEILGEPVDVSLVDVMVSPSTITVSVPEPEPEEQQLTLDLSTEPEEEESVVEDEEPEVELEPEEVAELESQLEDREPGPGEVIPEGIKVDIEPEPVVEPPKAMAAAAGAASPPVEDSVFADIPVARPKKVVEVVHEPVAAPQPTLEIPQDGKPTYEMVDLDEPNIIRLRSMMGDGPNTIRVIYRGRINYLKNKARNTPPEEYVVAVHGISQVSKS